MLENSPIIRRSGSRGGGIMNPETGMTSGGSRTSGDGDEWVPILFAIGVIAFVFALMVPVTVGFVIFAALRRYLTRKEWAMVLATGLFGLALSAGVYIIDYVAWLQALLLGTSSRWDAPVVFLLLCGMTLAGAAGTIMNTKLTAKAPAYLFPWFNRFDNQTLMPSAKKRKRAGSVATPGGLTVSAHSNSILDPGKVGTREFPIGIDENLLPVMLTEQEIGMHGLILGSTGSGKALALDTPIPTPSGWTTMGELSVGDFVLGADGLPARVSFATGVQTDRTCYEVSFSDGSTIVADAEHRWLTETAAARASESRARTLAAFRRRTPGDHRDQRSRRILPAVVTTEEIAATLKGYDGRANHSIKVAAPLELPEAQLPIHPYVLGAWLGDGRRRDGGLTCADPQIVEEIRECGYTVAQWADPKGDASRIDAAWGIQGIMPRLRELGVLREMSRRDQNKSFRTPRVDGHKHIPVSYLRASRQQRLALLQGLMDTDGTINESGNCCFDSCDRVLAEGVRELVNSLGMQARIREGRAVLEGVDHGPKYTVAFTTALPVFRLARKLARLPETVRVSNARVFVTEVREIQSVPVRCIQVDNDDHLYLAGPTMIVTHNTETIKSLAGALLDMGWSGMILDLKEDAAPGGLRDFCSDYGLSHSVLYQELRASDPDSKFWFNPLSGIGADEANDSIISLLDFDDAYWQSLNRKMLAQILRLYLDVHQIDPVQFPYPTTLELGRCLEQGDKIPSYTKKMRAAIESAFPGKTKEDYPSLIQPSADMAKSATGFGTKLTTLYDSSAGRSVLRPATGRVEIDVTRDGLTYVGLDTLGKPDLSRIISSSMLQRMSVFASQRATGQVKRGASRFLIVDEANWVNREIVMNLLSRARSAGIVLFLCTQGPLDWTDKDGDDWPRMTQNVNVVIIMSQGEPKSAEVCADYIGMTDKYTVMRQVQDGRMYDVGSARVEIAHRINPQQLREMGIGEAVMRVGKPAERLHWMKIQRRDPRLMPSRR